MIVTVTPNPALDVTYRVPRLRPGAVHRVSEVRERAGGKGVNVARVLSRLGEPVTVTGLCGGPTGSRLRTELAGAGLVDELVEALPDVRRTLVVHGDDGVTTSLWEPGQAPEDPYAAARRLTDRVQLLLARGATAVVVSGSLPPGVEANLPAQLAGLAAAAGVPVVVDADGAPLAHAVAAGTAVVTPNREELSRLGDHPVGEPAQVYRAVRAVRAQGAPAVVATMGADGMVAVTPAGGWRAVPPVPVTGNPTGAGDAAVAALARALAGAGDPAAVDWPEALRDAVALSAAAVACPVAGEVALEHYRRWRSAVLVEPLPAAD